MSQLQKQFSKGNKGTDCVVASAGSCIFIPRGKTTSDEGGVWGGGQLQQNTVVFTEVSVEHIYMYVCVSTLYS